MRNIKLELNNYGITLNKNNPNLLIHGKVGTGKSSLVHKLTESIKHDFIFIGNRDPKRGEGFIIHRCKDGLDIGTPQGITESSPEHIGNLSDLEMRLIKEIEERELIEYKEQLSPILVILDELDFLVAERYEKELSAFEYKSRMSYCIQKGSKMGIYFILTSQSKDILPIKESLFITQIETRKVDSSFTADCLTRINL